MDRMERRHVAEGVTPDVAEDLCPVILGEDCVECCVKVPVAAALAESRGTRHRHVGLGVDRPALDAEGFADATLPEPAPRRRRGKAGRRQRRVDWSAYETEVVEHDLADADRACPACGSALAPMGYEVTRELAFVPARVRVVEHRTMKYVCRACSARNRADGGETPSAIVRAEAWARV